MNDARRHQADLRRIVGVSDTQGGLDPAETRPPVLGARGIYQIGSGETKSGAAPGEDENGDPTEPVMPDETDENQNEDGSGTGGTGTDSDETDGDEYQIDPDDTGNYSPGDSSFGGGWASGGPATFSDCESGKCIQLIERGGYVPPVGWDDADTPPFDEQKAFDYGYYPDSGWTGSGGQLFATARAALDSYPNVVFFSWDFGGTHPSTVSINGLAAGRMSILGAPNPGNGPVLSTQRVPSNPENLDGFDDLSPDTWPSDNCIQLTKNNAGQWAASQYENPSDMTAKYSEAKSTLDLCAPGGDGVQILPGADGGTVRWNYTKGIFMATSPSGQRSFGGATEVTTAVAGSVAGGGGIKPQGAPRPGD